MKRFTRLGIALGGVAVALSLVTTTPAAADAGSDCIGRGQVWVVVQSPAGTRTGCASSFGNGEYALRSAGMSIQHNSTGMICQINGYPEICEESPMPYWAYFHAPAGGSWSYANFGAANRTPPAGSAEGWRFGTGEAPNVRVPDKPAPPPPPAPATTARPSSAPPTTSAPSRAPSTPAGKPATRASQSARATTSAPSSTKATKPTRPAAPSTRAPSSAPSTAPTSGAPSASASPSTAPTPADTPSASASSVAPTAAPPVATVVDSGSSTGVLITGGVVGAVALGAGGFLWFRSRNGVA